MKPRRILIATDAWRPQVNGVVRTLETTAGRLGDAGHVVEIVQPGDFAHWPVPFYPEICLAAADPIAVRTRVRRFRPDHVHIATEGPIGLAVRESCKRLRWNHSSSYHTKFPEYLRSLVGVPAGLTYLYMRWFHGNSRSVMTATPSLEGELRRRGFAGPFRRWSRGVDLDLFHPRPKSAGRRRPVLLYVGRVSKEKNVEAFLRLKAAGTKVVVGDGPHRGALERQYADAEFLGYRRGGELAAVYADADVLIFPSKTDTFGLVIIEAMASGLPVAAHPAPGPIDIITEPHVGAIDDDLSRAVEVALRDGNGDACVRHARQFTWENATEQFLSNLVDVRRE